MSCSGTLPSTWAQAGAFPNVKELVLINLPVQGTLPSAWGTQASFPSLETLKITATPDNVGVVKLSGTLPTEWGSLTGFQKLHYLNFAYVNITGRLPKPGNPYNCKLWAENVGISWNVLQGSAHAWT